MKKYYIHIGAPKTGTSAIQYFLNNNRELLAQSGFYYPPHLVDNNGISSGNAEELFRAIKNGDSKSLMLLAHKFSVAEQDNVILSSEYLFFADPEVVHEYFPSARIILYVRRQDFKIISAYGQEIKRMGNTLEPHCWLKKTLDGRKRGNHDYTRIDKWAKVYGEDNILVRPFENQQFSGGNIYSDFLDALGIRAKNSFNMPEKRINISYNSDAMEFKRLANLLTGDKLLFDAELQNYSSIFPGDKYSFFSKQECLDIIRNYSEGNQHIAEKYLGRKDGKLFYDPMPNEGGDTRLYPGLTGEKVIEIADFVMVRSPGSIFILQQGITNGLKSNVEKIKDVADILSPVLEIKCPVICMKRTNKERIVRAMKKYLPLRVKRFLKRFVLHYIII